MDGPPTVELWTRSRSLVRAASVVCAMAVLPGCFSNAKLTTEETEAYEVQEVRNAMEEIQNDSSLRLKEKEDAIRRLQERLGVMTGGQAPAK